MHQLAGTILKLVADNRGPVGQGALTLRLREQGFTVSPPTVGRQLQTLEFNGMLRKVGVEGRIITDRGISALQQWEVEARLHGSGEALLTVLKGSDKEHILDVLEARRIVEGGGAALAAERASAAGIRRMEGILDRQTERAEHGDTGIDEDILFHQEIVRESGNEALIPLVALLRNHVRYTMGIPSIRAIVGGRIVVDHMAILNAIKARDPVAARRTMEEHLQKLAADVREHWHTVVRERGRDAVRLSGGDW